MEKDYRQMILSALASRAPAALTWGEVVQACGFTNRQTGLLYAEVGRLRGEGRLILHKKRFSLPKTDGLFGAEMVRVHDTFGFARLEDLTEVFIPGRFLEGAMPGDKVLVSRHAQGDGLLDEGRVFEVTEPSDALISGTVSVVGDEAFLVPDLFPNRPMLLVGGLKGARAGDLAVAAIAQRGSRHVFHRAEVVMPFGPPDSAKNRADAVAVAAGVARTFPDGVSEEADRLCAAGIGEEDMAGREDLRALTVFTIDGADTKDIDDAVSLEKTDAGYRLGVHIADVSHYVRWGSPTDAEAAERGTSVYYADRVIPMLPPGLSNGICSLNPGEDRLAFSVFAELDESGGMTGFRFFKSVIRSRLKGVYGEVNALAAGRADAAVLQKYAPVLEPLRLMLALSEKLAARRAARGAIDLDSSECKIRVDESGEPLEITPAVHGAAEALIEAFMLLANQAAAQLAEARELPFVFRAHDRPAPGKMAELYKLLDVLGISAGDRAEEATPADCSRILAAARETPYRRAVNNALLRSMAKAVYSDRSTGHFGLALGQYTHFTSPIRRYPDLFVHRALSLALSGEAPAMQGRLRAAAHETAARGSDREQRATGVERTCTDVYKAAYIRPFVGQIFEAVLVSAQPTALYAGLENTVEGRIRADTLPGDSYDFDGAVAHVGRATGRRFMVGDSVRVRVLAASVATGRVDFEIVL